MKNIIRRIISTVLCYFMLLSLVPSSAIVAMAATYGGSGTEASPYLVSSQAELVSVLSAYNTAGVYIKLTKDITLDASYVPGTLNATLDGDFHKITAQTHFFDYNKGTLKNFYYTNTVTRVNTTGSYAGIVCDQNGGTISGIIATGHIDNTDSGASRAGIIAGTSSTAVVNCAAFGSVKVYGEDGSRAGGIVFSGNVVNCYAAVSVSATGGSRYGTSAQSPLTLDTITNSYYEADTGVTGSVSAAEMKTDAFVALLNSNAVQTDSKWVKDTQNKNAGYPVLQRALNVTITSSKTDLVLNGTEYVSLGCSDSGATIYYTLNGATPTTSSARYTGAITISNSTILTVIAYKSGMYSAPQRFLFAKVSGSGTQQDPYKIDSEPALHAISELGGDDYYVLTKNIALTTPMPAWGTFKGHFDGRGYEISNLYAEKRITGLISTNYGIVENLTFRTKENTALMADTGFAFVNYGMIYNCHFKGALDTSIRSGGYLGGICGENYGRIENCSFDGAAVFGGAKSVGGLVGNNTGTIAYCNFNGSVYADDVEVIGQGYLGGLVGYNSGKVLYSNVTATRVYAYARSYAGVYVGALIGGGSYDSVINCTADVGTLSYDKISYTEWGSFGTNRNVGKTEGVTPTPHVHDLYFGVDAPVCGKVRHKIVTCDCGISVELEYFVDEYYNLSHQYVETVVEPTCTQSGTSTKVCENCGYTVVKTIPATGHKTAIPYFKITNDENYPFNIVDGVISSTNNASYSTSELKLEVLQDHTLSFKYYLSSYNSSCKLYVYLNGSQKCYTYSNSVSNQSIAVKAGDVITIKFVKDTSTTTAYTGFVELTSPYEEKIPFACHEPAICQWCGVEITPELVSHTWDEGVFTTPWGCTSDGVKLYTCTKCGETKTENYTATGHQVTVDTAKAPELKNDKTYPFSYSNGKYTSTNKANNSTSTFTVVAWYNCSITYTYGVSSESSFDYFTIYKNGSQLNRISGSTSSSRTLTLVAGDVLTFVYSKDSSSSSGSDNGYFTITSCKVTGVDGDGKIPAENMMANCAGAVVCENCGLLIKEALEHTWDKGAVTTAPTHMTEGEKTFSCTACDATKTEAVEKLTAHEWNEGVVTTEPTHMTEGVKTFTCICGETRTETVEKLAAHEWDEGVVTTEPTHVDEGVKTFTCICGETYTQPVAPLGHEYSAAVTAPTCTEKGYTTYTCSCGDSYTADEVNALGHSYGNWYEMQAPHCTREGADERECSVCGDIEVAAVPATGHTLGDAIIENEVDATCTADGSYDSVIYCLACGAECARETNSVEKLGHDYSAEWTEDLAATCTVDGSKSHHCTRCEDKSDVTVIPAGGHSFGDWNQTEAPTCTKEGAEERECAACQEKETRPVAIVEHTAGDAVAETKVQPGCTTTGLYDSVVYCTVCEEELSREEKISDSLGHAYTQLGNCSACGEYRATFSGASLTLEDNLSVNFKVDPAQFNDGGYTDPYVLFTFNGEDLKVTGYTLDSRGRYTYTFSDIAPRMMNDIITAKLCATYEGEEVVCQVRTYSVKEYCYNMLSRCNEGGAYANNAKFKALLVDLLNYGEAAQYYGDYQVDDLVTAELTETQKTWATATKPTLTTVQSLTYKTIENPSVTWKAGGLLLEDSVTMRFKLVADSIDGLTVKFTTNTNKTGWTVDASKFVLTTGGYYVYFDGLKARQMRETVYVTVYSGNTAVSNTVSYSIESYAYAKRNDSNAKLVALLEAMMKYGDSAYKYIYG